MRTTHVLLAVVLLVLSADSQVQDGYVWSYYAQSGTGFNPPRGGASTYSNNGVTGTQCNQLVKQDASGNAIVTSGGETQGVIGVATAGCGTSGAVIVFSSGDVPVLFDASSVTVSDYVGISAASGHVTDAGTSPPSGQLIGQIRNNPTTGAAPANCNTGGGCYVHLELGTGSGGGGGGGGCVGGCVALSPGGSQTINQPMGSTLTINSPSNPVKINATGSYNGLTFPDSGTAGQTVADDNTAGFVSGSTPGTNTCYNGGNTFQPLFSAKISGVPYSTELEQACNKDQKGGYPSLDPNVGLVPINEIVQDPSNCGNAGFVIAGSQANCIGGASSTHFSGIQTTGAETNSGPGAWIIGNGLNLRFDGLGGIINANLVNYTSFPSGQSGGALNALNAVPIVVASNVSGATMGAMVLPHCIGPGSALGFNDATHTAPCNNVALNAAHPMIRFTCNGTNNGCPNTSGQTGIGSTAIFYAFTLAANQLSADGQCLNVRLRWKHSTAAASVAYSWNVGGTGSVGGAVTGGLTTPTASNNTGASALIRSELTVCRDLGAVMTNIYTDQFQFGTNTGGSVATNGSIDWTQPQQINLLFNVANTDVLTFWGGEAYYP